MYRYCGETSGMKNTRVSLRSAHNFATRVDHRERRTVAYRNSVKEATTLSEEFKNMRQWQITEENVISFNNYGVAEGFQRGNHVLVREQNSFWYAS